MKIYIISKKNPKKDERTVRLINIKICRSKLKLYWLIREFLKPVLKILDPIFYFKVLLKLNM
jgi:hypothetical protein